MLFRNSINCERDLFTFYKRCLGELFTSNSGLQCVCVKQGTLSVDARYHYNNLVLHSSVG